MSAHGAALVTGADESTNYSWCHAHEIPSGKRIAILQMFVLLTPVYHNICRFNQFALQYDIRLNMKIKGYNTQTVFKERAGRELEDAECINGNRESDKVEPISVRYTHISYRQMDKGVGGKFGPTVKESIDNCLHMMSIDF